MLLITTLSLALLLKLPWVASLISSRPFYGKRCIPAPLDGFRLTEPKPQWVINEILRMKALMPDQGCRKLADSFNRRFQSKGMSVGKTWVNNTIQRHRYEIQIIRRQMKHRRPKPVPRHLIWGIDLTGKTDNSGHLHNILGIVEHASRGCLFLSAVPSKSSLSLLKVLIAVIEQVGKPKIIRTDNEAVFTSRLFRLGLWMLGIRHQTTDLHCPWQNGRIERLFGTLKEKLNQWTVIDQSALNHSLYLFRFWYNHIRPHQYLDGRTPAEVYNNQNIFKTGYRKKYWFEEWDGLLAGYYLKI